MIFMIFFIMRLKGNNLFIQLIMEKEKQKNSILLFMSLGEYSFPTCISISVQNKPHKIWQWLSRLVLLSKSYDIFDRLSELNFRYIKFSS